MTDEEIIQKVIKGQREYFSILVDRYKDKIYSMAYHYTNGSIEAEDLAQEVFVKIFQKVAYFNYKSKFSTWVYKVAMNSCTDWHRKNKKWSMIYLSTEPKDIIDKNDVEGIIVNNENKETLINCITKLKDKYKFAIILYYCQNLSIIQMSEILNLPEKTVYTRIRRGRKQLCELIEKYSIGVDDL